jgi:hypothetical protein
MVGRAPEHAAGIAGKAGKALEPFCRASRSWLFLGTINLAFIGSPEAGSATRHSSGCRSAWSFSQQGRVDPRATKRAAFVVAAHALSRISPDGVWRFSVEKYCETSRLLDAVERIQSQYWCQKRTHPINAID